MIVTDSKGRSHRTALFVDAHDLSDPFGERVNRLLESLNGVNIKVDVFRVGANGSGIGTVRVSGQPGSLAHNDVSEHVVPASELSAWAREAGYTQVLISVRAGTELD